MARDPAPCFVSHPPKSLLPARIALRFLDLAGGLAASIAAFVVGTMIWAFLTGDTDGGEPFANSFFGGISLMPVFLVLVIAGPFAWWHRRTLKERVKIFGYQVLADIVVLGLSFLVGR